MGRLAIGGMAEVWAAQLLAAGGFRKPMVIKRILPELASNPSFLKMLMSEARVAARLSHTNICQVFELGEVEGEYYIAMEYLRGVPLTHLLKNGGALPPAEAVAIVAQACDGLHYAHEQRDSSGTLLGLVHRDVSPHNLFVTVDGVLKVLDFGIAKVDDGSTDRTEAGKVKGKLPYMSPEQLAAESLDSRSDVWSLGVVLWELLTGRRLFGGASPAFTVDAIRNARIPLLDAPALDAVLSRAMCRNREWRYATAGELRRAMLTAIEPMTPATPEMLAKLVWERSEAQIRTHDRMFEEDDVPSGVVDRLPLRAEATGASQQMMSAGSAEALLRARARADTLPTRSEIPRADTAPDIDIIVDSTALSAASDAQSGVVPGPGVAAGETVLDAEVAPEPPRRAAVLWIGGGVMLVVALVVAVLLLRSDRDAAKHAGAVAGNAGASGAPGAAGDAVRTGTPPDSADRSAANEPAGAAPPTDPPPDSADLIAAAGAGGGAGAGGVGGAAAGGVDGAGAGGVGGTAGAPSPGAPSPSGASGTAAGAGSARAGSGDAEGARSSDKDRRDKDRRDKDRVEASAKPKVTAKPGRLHVDARPWATIYLDGKSLGVTPIVGVSVSAGEHTVKAVSEDGKTKTLRITVESGGEVRRRITW